MQRNQLIKLLMNVSLAVAFVCAVGLLLGYTYGYADLARTGFYLFGGLGLLLNIYVSYVIEKDKEFNWLFWVGTVFIFGAVIMKTLHINNFHVVLLVGAGITGFSYFFNPFNRSDDKQDQDDKLLDQ